MIAQDIVQIIAKDFILLPVIGLAIVFYRLDTQRRIELIAVAAIAGVLSLLFAKIGGHFYSDPRPYIVGHFTPLIHTSTDNGFPSDHSLLAAFLACVGLYYSRLIGSILVPLAVLIGLTRMAVGAHHAIDVFGAFVFATAATGIAIYIVKYAQHYKPRSTPKPVGPS